MSVEEYCLKVKAVADKLACAGSPVSEKDLLMQILNGLGPGFLDLASIITANRMSYDDAYALLLTHEARMEQNHNTKDLFSANYGMMNANYSQFRGNNKRGGYSGYQGQFNAGNRNQNGGRGMSFNSFSRGFPAGGFSGNAGGRGQQMNAYTYKPMLNNRHNFNMNHGSTSMSNGNGSDDNVLICQICHKAGHAADVCWHRHFDGYAPQPRQFGRGRGHKSAYMANFDPQVGFTSQFEDSFATEYTGYQGYHPPDMNASVSHHSSDIHSAPGAAYIANFEGPADEGWYLDSGATHHITNNMANKHIRDQFTGADQLIIGNGQGLPITHVGDASFLFKSSNSTHKHSPIALKDILLVPSITKNLLSISKLTTDNNLSVEFLGNVCFVKDSLRGQVLLQGLAEKGLYRLLLKSSSSSQLSSSFLSHMCSNKPLSMLSCCCFNSVPSGVFTESQKSCNQTDDSSCKTSVNKAILLHRKFGHPNHQILTHILKTAKSIHLPAYQKQQMHQYICEACQMGKTHRLHFPITETKTSKILELIHTDLWGPSPIISRDGYQYYISFVDDYSRYTWIYPLKLKSEALEVFKLFKLQVENQFSTTIKMMQSDWGGEYRPFTEFLSQFGIIFRHPCPYTHHQNGLVERKHRHIVELGLTLLAQAQLPFKFWWDAFHTAVYHINRLPSPVLQLLTPYEKTFKHKPDYDFLRCFGCSCYPYLRDYNKHKFAYHSSKCIFISYSPSHKGYKCLHHSGRVYVARHVTFDESVFPYATEFVFHSHAKTDSQISHSFTPQQIHHISSLPVNNSTGNLNSVRSGSSSSSHSNHLEQTATDQNSQQAIINDKSPFHTCPTIVESIQNIPEPPHHSLPIQSHHPSNTYFYPYTQPNTHQMITRSKAGIFKPKIYTAVLTHKEPDNVQEALNDSKWLQAMREEYDALIKNNTWTLVPRQADQHVVGNKWVYRVKYNTDGSVAKYKARLVAKGFQQVAGINYFETFSPVVKSATVRVILSLAVMNQWRIRQVDVNNAFLNGELTKEVFMSQPDGFIDAQRSDFVCKLHKSLYGLKQAPRAWYDKLKRCLMSWGFTTTSSDTSLFVRKIKTSMIIVLIYVDDILITGPNTEELEGFITEFSKTFALKDLGVLSYFLGIEVLYDANCMYLSQRKYIRDLLSKVEMAECKGIDTPMSTGSKLQKIVQGELGYYLEDPTHYRSIVGGMQYLILTRPEIAFAVNKLSQYVAAPTLQHLMACKRVLRYLKATQDYGLKFFREGSLTLTSFTDADWACDLDDRKSVGAYCIYLGNNLISWSSKKQSVITRSSAESEYRALASVSAELTWLQSLFSELGISCIEKPIIWCDNISATELAKNLVYHSRTKHIEIDMHFIRNKVLAGELIIHYVPSEEQIADIMTKPLSFVRFNYLRSKLNVHLCPLSLRGAVRAAHYAEQKKVKTKMKKIQSKLQGKCVSGASSADSSAD
ncbi:retrovirus-related pol polyprotein from transposon RE2 [Citrus sinensis]|nr:retrovirus-related pol polyprotein from transposon RE2 [Citrus sinensis]